MGKDGVDMRGKPHTVVPPVPPVVPPFWVQKPIVQASVMVALLAIVRASSRASSSRVGVGPADARPRSAARNAMDLIFGVE